MEITRRAAKRRSNSGTEDPDLFRTLLVPKGIGFTAGHMFAFLFLQGTTVANGGGAS